MPDISKDELRKEWIAALRSGNFNQTRSTLHDSHGFCCLGVLCEVLADKGIVKRGNFGRGYFVYRYDTQDQDGILEMGELLATPVRSIVGLTREEQATLSKLNDGDVENENNGAKTFAEIADYLEKEVFAQ